jgi:hypothetical protein
VSAAAISGCKTKAEITGRVVTPEGQPVTAGTLVFSPVPKGDDDTNPGAPVPVQIQPDGSFKANVAVVGTMRVVYTPPGPDYPEGYTPAPSEPAPVSPFAGLSPMQNEVEVTKGENTLDIGMVRPTPLP